MARASENSNGSEAFVCNGDSISRHKANRSYRHERLTWTVIAYYMILIHCALLLAIIRLSMWVRFLQEVSNYFTVNLSSYFDVCFSESLRSSQKSWWVDENPCIEISVWILQFFRVKILKYSFGVVCGPRFAEFCLHSLYDGNKSEISFHLIFNDEIFDEIHVACLFTTYSSLADLICELREKYELHDSCSIVI